MVLELAMGGIDAAHVDAYSGPQRLREQAIGENWSLKEIDQRAGQLAQELTKQRTAETASRIDALNERITALRMRVAINDGRTTDFDSEALALFGTKAPDYDADHFDDILAEIATLIPGEGPLVARVERFLKRFDIPAEKVDKVFKAALTECRRRTLARISLPEHESFKIEYVTDQSWSGYNWYQGNAHSLIQINTDFPLSISGAVNLGCHEAYPGHHTHNALLEQELRDKRGWIEYSLYPLFSPQSFIAEGAGNYGIELAFPGDERVQFERAVLFPLAGLDATSADKYYQLKNLMRGLSYAQNEAARDYLNGSINRQQAIDFLVDYGLSKPDRAEQRVRFIDDYRSYVINYNFGQDLVRKHIERGGASEALKWQRFSELLSSPASARNLVVADVRGFDHIGLVVRDLDASKTFFTDVLGFSLVGSDTDYPAHFLNNGEAFVTLWRASDPDTAIRFNRKNNVGLHHMALEVASEAALNRLHEIAKAFPGVVVEFPPEAFYGGPSRHMMIYEPSGNRIELIYRAQ